MQSAEAARHHAMPWRRASVDGRACSLAACMGLALKAIVLLLCLQGGVRGTPARGQPHGQAMDASPAQGDLVCSRASALPALAAPHWPRAQDQAIPAEADCWISLQALEDEEKKEKAPRTIWVDVRPTAQAQAQPLGAGVLRVALQEMAGKQFLRQERLALIGTGLDKWSLAQACTHLQKSGFAHARLLAGGVRAWAQAGRFVGGSAPVLTHTLGAQEFLQGSLDGALRILAVNLDAQAAAHLPRPPARALHGGVQKVIGQIAKSSATATPPQDYWVVVAPDAAAQQALLGAWQQTHPPLAPTKVLWLHGGWAAYQQYIEQQHRIRADKGRSLQRGCSAP